MDFSQSQENQGVEYHRNHFQENFPCLETKEIGGIRDASTVSNEAQKSVGMWKEKMTI